VRHDRLPFQVKIHIDGASGLPPRRAQIEPPDLTDKAARQQDVAVMLVIAKDGHTRGHVEVGRIGEFPRQFEPAVLPRLRIDFLESYDIGA
jgi:hypothetical protein